MDTFAADLLESVHGLDDQIPTRISKSHSPTTYFNAHTETNANVVEDIWNVNSEGMRQKNSSAHGGRAEVVKATLKRAGSTELQVAVKKLRYGDDTTERKLCNEFVHEVDMMAQLLHRNIARLIGFVEELEEGKAWIVMCWEPNGNVSEFLATGEWEIPERISLIQDTFAGIEYLHTRQPPICHGDLKSLNILVSASYRAVITDFGSARILKEIKELQQDRVKPFDAAEDSAIRPGTDERIDRTRITIVASNNQLTLTGPAWSLRWAAPEVALGEPQSLASDVWAAGWICWEVVTNRVPFPELNSEGAIVLKVVEGQVPAVREDTQLSQVIRLCSLMTDCWAFDPQNRPNIVRCHTEVRWIVSFTMIKFRPLLTSARSQPSVRPSERMTLGTGVPSAELLLQMGLTRGSQGRYRESITLCEQALSIATSTGDQAMIAAALKELGEVYIYESKYAEAKQHVTRAQDIYTQIGNEIGQAHALRLIGRAYHQQSKLTEAERSYTQARTIYVRHEHAEGQAMTSRALGNISYGRSQSFKAEEFYNEAIDICARIGNDFDHASTLMRLGELFRSQSEYTKAEESFNRALEKYSRIGNNLGRAHVKYDLAGLYSMQGLNTKAAPLYAEARTIYAQVGNSKWAERCSHLLDDVSKEGDSAITSPVSYLPRNDDDPSPTH
ncbi:hypothetical protein FS837_001771 [Tulasnella sp. UAMH 9824]|nr:hypothetical protein FS837_001771 [Tulasnella sp. UAMH 9824]